MAQRTTYTTTEMHQIVENIFLANGKCYAKTAAIMDGVTPATIWKILNGKQKESPVVRNALNLPKPTRTRFTADVSRETIARIDAALKRHGLTRSEFIEKIDGGIVAMVAGESRG